jgi:hypothetical protein
LKIMTKQGIYDASSSDIPISVAIGPLIEWLVMIKVTYLPLFVTLLFRGMPGMWKARHRLILCWLVVMQALFPGRKTLAELARWTPAQVTAWRFRRLVNAAYWDVHILVEWWLQEALPTLPPPQDGLLYVVGDGSEHPKRGKPPPGPRKAEKAPISLELSRYASLF